MTRLAPMLSRFRTDETGSTAIEYGLLAALLSVVVVGAVTATGTKLYTLINRTSTALAG